jgi:DNA-directed RNA polymerase subunit M/transcription elongation factor TFIIS
VTLKAQVEAYVMMWCPMTGRGIQTQSCVIRGMVVNGLDGHVSNVLVRNIKLSDMGGKKMRVKQITYQHRRDFKAIFECEHCGHEEEMWGYDDSYFHENVIPAMKCGKCGKQTDENYKPLTPKYPDHAIV